MKINGAMYNGMSERYMDIMQYKSDPKEAEVRSVFYWAMSAIELTYWEHRGQFEVDAELLVNEERVSLMVSTIVMSKTYIRSFEHTFDRAEIEDFLKAFAEVFNYTDSLVRMHFHADGPKPYGQSNLWTQVLFHVDVMEK